MQNRNHYLIIIFCIKLNHLDMQKQLPRAVLKKKCSENIQQIYSRHPCRRAISIKELCNFIEIAVWHRCSPVNLLHNFRIHFPKNRSAGYFWKRIVFWIRSFENWFLAGNNLMPVCSNKNFRIFKITTKVTIFTAQD